MSCSHRARLVRASGRCSGVNLVTSHLAYTTGMLKETLRREAKILADNPEDRRQGVVDPYSLPSLETLPHIVPGRLLDSMKKACTGCGASPDRPGLWYTIGNKVYCEDCAPRAARDVSAGLLIPNDAAEDKHSRRKQTGWAEKEYRQNTSLLGVTPTSLNNQLAKRPSVTAARPPSRSAAALPPSPAGQIPGSFDTSAPGGEPIDHSSVFIDRLREPGRFVSGPAASPTYCDTDGRPMAIARPMSLKKRSGSKVFESGGQLLRGQLDELYLLADERGNPSGWAITPVLAEMGGRIVPTNRWTVTHMASGVDVTTQSFEIPQAALELGEKLAQIQVDLTSDREFRRIAATIRATLQAYQNGERRRDRRDSEGGLTHQIGLDHQGEAVRVLEDLDDILVVTNQTGQTCNLPRYKFRETEVFDDDD